jgi:2-polyprenyl-6-methoxyphenol hydroxylase-like FAD-dependent oxidoreductase
MLKIFRKKFCSKLETDVCIIGGGSIGMTLSNLFSKYKINHLVLEKEKSKEALCNHPKAHYISPRTVETFKYFDLFQFDFEKNKIQEKENRELTSTSTSTSTLNGGFFNKNYFDNVNNWRHYRYCEYLLDENSYLGEIDHLKPGKKIE